MKQLLAYFKYLKNKILSYGFFGTIAGKVTLVTIAGFLTVFTIHSSIGKAFEKITGNIDELTKPNQRLIQVNHLFRNISRLNHILQEETASGRKELSPNYFYMADSIFDTIDTLKTLFENDPLQLIRISDIEDKLHNREEIVTQYLEIQHRLETDPGLTNLIKQINQNNQFKETNHTIPATEGMTPAPSDTINQQETEQNENIWNRIFGRNKNKKRKETDATALTETSQTRNQKDTINNGVDSLLREVEKSLEDISTQRQHLSAILQNRQVKLLNTNNFLVQEIISVINQVEQEEMEQQNAETRASFTTAAKAIKLLNTIAVIFISTSIILFILIIFDLSKSNRYRKQLEVAHQKARDEAEARKHFLSNMSHEIRTPLQSIYGYAEQARLQPEKPVNTEAIYQSAHHLLQVVNEVLDYSSVTSGKMVFETKPFQPFTELQTVIDSLKPIADKKGLELKLKCTFDEKLSLIGDAYRLRQILFNIVGNAVKFTEEGHVTIKADYNTKNLNIKIKDTGIGISEEQIPRLFKEYSQSDTSISSKFGGTGLGLSISKQLTELQKGTITLKSAINQGSTFTINIPYNHVDKTSEQNVSNTKEIKYDGLIYLADDDPLILNLCHIILEKNRIKHRTFSKGEELIKAYKEQPAGIIITDIRMPDIDGTQICQTIKTIAKQRVDIYALTAEVMPEDKKRIISKGFTAIVNKPFKETDLLEILHEIKQERKPTEEIKIDISDLQKLSVDDPDFLRTIMSTVSEETSKDLLELKKCINHEDMENTLLIIHRLAGRTGQVGARDVSGALRDTETLLKKGTPINTIKEQLAENCLLTQGFLAEVSKIQKEI
ncbi:ATP-binding response regulator [Geofilum sp. OHC36d9]|uniref:ATP-binding response regulator n=1 Tax=Geofilum sp. OHC36d9 TaxID=3458413 RepID=UPI004033A51D